MQERDAAAGLGPIIAHPASAEVALLREGNSCRNDDRLHTSVDNHEYDHETDDQEILHHCSEIAEAAACASSQDSAPQSLRIPPITSSTLSPGLNRMCFGAGYAGRIASRDMVKID